MLARCKQGSERLSEPLQRGLPPTHAPPPGGGGRVGWLAVTEMGPYSSDKAVASCGGESESGFETGPGSARKPRKKKKKEGGCVCGGVLAARARWWQPESRVLEPKRLRKVCVCLCVCPPLPRPSPAPPFFSVRQRSQSSTNQRWA